MRDLRKMSKEQLRVELAVTTCALLAALAPVTALAGGVGLKAGWFWTNLKTAVLIVAVGLSIMFFIQRQTAKMITTLVLGGFLYLVASAPASVFTAFGNLVKSLIGLK